ncbi:MAG: hypothetical protein R6X07_16415 [Desulfatiglandales bacterium]
MAVSAEHGEVLRFIEDNGLMAKGLGFVDMQLLASALLSGLQFRTLDKRLRQVALKLGLAFCFSQAEDIGFLEMAAGEFKSFFGDTHFFRIGPVEEGLQLGFAADAWDLSPKMEKEVVNGNFSSYIVHQ